MELVWSPEAACKAYIDTVKMCKNIKESGTPELLSAMAAGWNSTLIVETWSQENPMTTSLALAIAASHAHGHAKHVCIVPDEQTKTHYLKAMQESKHPTITPPCMFVGKAEEAMKQLTSIDFLVVDCNDKDYVKILRCAKLSQNGAVLVRKNVWQEGFFSGFRWIVGPERRVVRSVILPVGNGIDVAHVSRRIERNVSRWIRHVDCWSGEEHVFRL